MVRLPLLNRRLATLPVEGGESGQPAVDGDVVRRHQVGAIAVVQVRLQKLLRSRLILPEKVKRVKSVDGLLSTGYLPKIGTLLMPVQSIGLFKTLFSLSVFKGLWSSWPNEVCNNLFGLKKCHFLFPKGALMKARETKIKKGDKEKKKVWRTRKKN